MKEKLKPEELRIKSSDFEQMMRRALGAPPIPQDKKKTKRKAAKK